MSNQVAKKSYTQPKSHCMVCGGRGVVKVPGVNFGAHFVIDCPRCYVAEPIMFLTKSLKTHQWFDREHRLSRDIQEQC